MSIIDPAEPYYDPSSDLKGRLDLQEAQRAYIPGNTIIRGESDKAGYAAKIEFRGEPQERRRRLSGKAIASALSDALGYASDVVRRGWVWRMGPAMPGRMLDGAESDRAGFGANLRYREGWQSRRQRVAGRLICDAVTDRAGYAAPGIVRRDGRSMPGGPVLPRFDTGIIHTGNGGQSLSRGQGAVPIKITGVPGAKMFVGGDRADTGPGTPEQNHASLVDYAPADGGAPSYEGETPAAAATLYLANAMAAAGRSLAARNQNILVSSWGQGGAAIASLSKGQPLYQRFLDDIRFGYARALELGRSYSLPLFYWEQGESDYLSGGAQSRAVYAQRLAKLRADYAQDLFDTTGQTETLHCLTYQVGTHNWYGQDPYIALAQLDLATGSLPFVMCGPMYVAQYREDVHLTTRGSEILGAYQGKAAAELMAGRRFKPLHPISMTRQGVVYRVKFHVPVAPLVLDTTLISDPNGQFGFELFDRASGQNIAISNIRVVGSDVVEFVAAANASPLVALRAAWSPPTGYVAGQTSPNNGSRCCLRDSDPTVFVGPDFTLTLRNYCAISEVGLD